MSAINQREGMMRKTESIVVVPNTVGATCVVIYYVLDNDPDEPPYWIETVPILAFRIKTEVDSRDDDDFETWVDPICIEHYRNSAQVDYGIRYGDTVCFQYVQDVEWKEIEEYAMKQVAFRRELASKRAEGGK